MILVKRYILYDHSKCLRGGRESNYPHVVLTYPAALKFTIFTSYGRYHMYTPVPGGPYNRILLQGCRPPVKLYTTHKMNKSSTGLIYC